MNEHEQQQKLVSWILGYVKAAIGSLDQSAEHKQEVLTGIRDVIRAAQPPDTVPARRPVC